MHNPALVSVIMSAYNAEKYLKDAIDSILNQTYHNFEFIIINDGSKDKTLSIIESYTDERIKVISHNNIGLTKSLNVGLKNAKGKYIARIDADDISTPNRISLQVNYLEEQPEIALLGSNYCMYDKKNKSIEYVAIPTSNNKLKKFLAIRGTPFRHSSVMFRREIANELGGYNEKFRHAQDYEFWIRFAEKHPVSSIPVYLCISRRNVEGSIVSTRSLFKTAKLTFQLKRQAFIKLNQPLYLLLPFLFFSIASIIPKSIIRRDLFKTVRRIANSLSLKSSNVISKSEMDLINKSISNL